MSQRSFNGSISGSQESAISHNPSTEDELSGFIRKAPVSEPKNDSIIRAVSPYGRRYLKPINGIQTKGFARSGR